MSLYTWSRATLLVLCFAAVAAAQGTITGTILGTVTDETGAVLPNVTITATQTATSQVRSTSTNGVGQYTLPFLPIGPYRLTAEKQGFKTEARSGFSLAIDQQLTANFTLAVGSVNEQISVNAEASQLKTESAEVSETFENKRVVALPLNGRQFVQLVLLTAGATPEPQGIFSQPFATAGQSPNVNGNRSDSNNYLLDGISINDITYNHLSASPSVDAIEEFKVQGALYTAEFGSAPGAQVNVTLKSGTNNFHGGAWEFFRNDVLDSRNFFDGRNVSPFRQNQFGGTLGGPIQKDKTFFFFNYEGLRIRKGIPLTSALPTQPLRNGDFTGFGTVYDPKSYSSTTNTSTPFLRNQIPADRFDASSKALLALIPVPASNQLGRNYTGFGPRRVDSDQVNVKGDRNFGPNNLLMARFTYSNIGDLEPVPGIASFETASAPVGPPGFGQKTAIRDVNAVLQYTRIFSSSISNQFRAGYNRTQIAQTQQNKTDFSAQTGIQGNDGRVFSNGVPVFSILGFSSLGGTTFDLGWRNNSYPIIDDLAWIRGRHTIKIGFSGEILHPNTQFLLSPRGSFTFRNIFTADPRTPGTTGQAFADFLLGLPNQAAAGVGNTLVYLRTYRIGTYVQDDWKVNSKLTINLGIRYEFSPRYKEKYNRWVNFDTRTGNFVLASDNGKTNPAAQIRSFPTLTFVTDQQTTLPRQSLVKDDRNNFAPRIGFAYTPVQNTVIRAGYGIFYTSLNASDGLSFNPPFFGNKSFLNSSFASLIPTETALISQTAVTPNAQVLAVDRPLGYVQQWSLNIQRDLGHQWIVEGIYLGSKGTKLSNSVSPNQAVPGPGPLTSRLPYPNLSPGLSYSSSLAWSTYESSTLKLQKAYSNGLVLASNYTWAHSIDISSSGNSNAANANKPQDSRNLSAEKGDSIFDARHRFVFDGSYDLPFGPGKRWANNLSGLGARLVEGFSFSGIITIQSRLPFSPQLGIDRSGTGVNQDRPNAIGDPNAIGNRTPDQFFNTGAFALQNAGLYGNAGRDTIRGPNLHDVDFSILKTTRVGEGRQLEFRAESFNLLNRPNFKLPNRIFGTPDFGKIFSAYDAREIQFGLKFVF